MIGSRLGLSCFFLGVSLPLLASFLDAEAPLSHAASNMVGVVVSCMCLGHAERHVEHEVHGFRSVEVLLDTPPGIPKSCPGAKGGSVRVQISPSRPVSVFMIKPRVCPSREQFSPVQSSRPLGFVQVLSDQPAAYRQRTLDGSAQLNSSRPLSSFDDQVEILSRVSSGPRFQISQSSARYSAGKSEELSKSLRRFCPSPDQSVQTCSRYLEVGSWQEAGSN
ncbi:hypothetical protein DY000_02014319 [Brassica cretica]|uniref:Secreted protein n=1 Tax=Brassica cretica TaxID=69181 RepID=A0ABQ7D8A7_BRACR|nr:hypothetical protein DY000_02014319 [Brassica cretica]